MPNASQGGSQELESRVADLERRLDYYRTAALVVVVVMIALLIPPIRAILAVAVLPLVILTLVLVIVTPVLALIRLVIWLLERIDPSGPAASPGGADF